MKELKNYHFVILTGLLFIVSKDLVFFWDNVLFGSKMAHHFYENNTFSLRLPIDSDPGHPPFLAIIMANTWKYLSHTLWASHLILTPFIIGFFYQLKILLKHYNFNNTYLFITFILILVDPTISSQLVLVGPEIFHLFFFILALNGLLKGNNINYSIGLFFLGITSFRGMFLCAGLFTFDISNHLFLLKKTLLDWMKSKKPLTYCIGALPALFFITWRLTTIGWLQTHSESPWSDCWAFVNFNMFCRNLVVLANRYLDFGRILVLFVVLIITLVYRTKVKLTAEIKQLLLLSLCSVLFIILVSLLSINPFGHRYFIISFIPLLIIVSLLLKKVFTYKGYCIASLCVILLLISGNFWVYPRSFSQGWDASLAHLPYSSLRNQAISYMEKHNIPISKSASFFPNNTSINLVDLSGNQVSFQQFNDTNSYVFYSNVYNLDDKTLKILKTEYTIIKSFNSLTVDVEILQRNP